MTTITLVAPTEAPPRPDDEPVRCADPACKARLTLDDAHETDCDDDATYCGDHIEDHRDACTVCRNVAYTYRDLR